MELTETISCCLSMDSASSIESCERLSVLASVAKWRGVSDADGEHQQIMKTLWSCKTNIKKCAEDHLPTGDLRDLAKDMANSSSDFHDKLHAHFEDEITKLTQLDIPKNEALELVLEQFALIFDRLFNCHQEILEYTGEDAVQYMV